MRVAVPLCLVGIVLLAVLAGCDQPPELEKHVGFVGTVSRVDDETNELLVRVSERRHGGHWAPSTKVFLVTAQSEIYINDMVRPMADIAPGDNAEVLAYVDPEHRTRYIVSLAHIANEQPKPTPPDLSIPPVAAPPEAQEE
ncbi:MAG: hypothetical protein JXO22_03420 [Phycisphaerae bacterium]|nr:hypothetical protein [Phycisphaerae bacterium]